MSDLQSVTCRLNVLTNSSAQTKNVPHAPHLCRKYICRHDPTNNTKRRVTVSDLQNIIFRLNVLTNNPTEEFTEDGLAFNTGCYVLYGAYGGHCLQQRVASGGVHTIISGYRSKRELYCMIHTYIDGLFVGVAMEATRNEVTV